MNAQPLLQVRQLTRDFALRTGVPGQRKTLRAVDGVSFDLHAGEILGIVGESGSGKSTLARMIMRLISPTSGTVQLGDVELTALDAASLREARRRFQMIFQDPYASLNPRWTVRAILEEPLRAQSIPRTEWSQRMRDVLDQVGLPGSFAGRYPHELSGGQRQRLNIGRALIPGPELLVADEPVAALDVSIQAQILNLLLDLQQEHHLSMLFIAHDLAVVKSLCNRVGVMRQGALVELAGTSDLFDAPQHAYTKALIRAIPRIRHAEEVVNEK